MDTFCLSVLDGLIALIFKVTTAPSTDTEDKATSHAAPNRQSSVIRLLIISGLPHLMIAVGMLSLRTVTRKQKALPAYSWVTTAEPSFSYWSRTVTILSPVFPELAL